MNQIETTSTENAFVTAMPVYKFRNGRMAYTYKTYLSDTHYDYHMLDESDQGVLVTVRIDTSVDTAVAPGIDFDTWEAAIFCVPDEVAEIDCVPVPDGDKGIFGLYATLGGYCLLNTRFWGLYVQS